jgi:hypothetical protein
MRPPYPKDRTLQEGFYPGGWRRQRAETGLPLDSGAASGVDPKQSLVAGDRDGKKCPITHGRLGSYLG